MPQKSVWPRSLNLTAMSKRSISVSKAILLLSQKLQWPRQACSSFSTCLRCLLSFRQEGLPPPIPLRSTHHLVSTSTCLPTCCNSIQVTSQVFPHEHQRHHSVRIRFVPPHFVQHPLGQSASIENGTFNARTSPAHIATTAVETQL